MRRANQREPSPPHVHQPTHPHAHVSATPSSSLSSPSHLSFSLLFLSFLLLRCVTALLLRSYFNPDEPWQSLEVAYSIAYPPFGHRTWEWTPTARIRGWAHVVPFIGFYHLIRTLQVDSAFMVAYGPRLLQAVLVAVADVHFYRLAIRLMGRTAAKWALLCYACNWFLLYTLVRTYSNSLETALSIIALAYWPWPALPTSTPSFPSHRRLSLLLAALAVIVRPPALIIWTVLGLQSIASTPRWLARAQFAVEAAVIGGALLGCSLCVDRAMYGEWVIAPYNFFALNSLQSISSLYGTHAWHWYLTEATPVLLSFSLPLFLYSLYCHAAHPLTRSVLPVMAVTVLAYSSNPHKEYRFILPLLPLATLHCGLSLSTQTPTWSRRGAYTVVLFAGNVALFLYFALVHQSGPISAVEFLAHRIRAQSMGGGDGAASVHFWMPCHSTPLYSYLHLEPRPELRFFDCAPTLPPLQGSAMDPAIAFSTHCTSSHLFSRSPAIFIAHVYNLTLSGAGEQGISEKCARMRRKWDVEDEQKPQSERRGGGRLDGLPTYVVLYSTHAEEEGISGVLSAHRYVEMGRFFHSHFDDEREVLVFEQQR